MTAFFINIMEPKYDFLIVGAGIFGATCARLLTDKGYNCLIIERNDHVGGLCYTYNKYNITVHRYGPHIFHTNNGEVWDFVNKYDKFNNYKHKVLANYNNKIYHLPFSMELMHELYDVVWPKDAIAIMKEQMNIDMDNNIYSNLENYAKSTLGENIYNIFINEYNEKKWFVPCNKLPYNLISELPIKYNYNNDYFNSLYQGVPTHGYTELIENIIGDDIDIMLNKDYLNNIDKYNSLASGVIYTGPVDVLMENRYGLLEWLSMRYEILDVKKGATEAIGNSVMTFTDNNVEWTRIIEHKYFNPERQYDKEYNAHTIVSYEYPVEWELEMLPFYCKLTENSIELYNKYKELIDETYPNLILGGRFGMYQNLSMAECVERAMTLCEQL